MDRTQVQCGVLPLCTIVITYLWNSVPIMHNAYSAYHVRTQLKITDMVQVQSEIQMSWQNIT